MNRFIYSLLLLISIASLGVTDPLWSQTRFKVERGVAAVASAPGGTSSTAERVYIVQLAAPPAAAKPEMRTRARSMHRGARRFDARSPAAREYVRRLRVSHDELLVELGMYQRKIYSYGYTFNGFAARLSEQQAAKLKSRRGILNVWKDHLRHVETADSPGFLGLTNPAGGLVNGLGLSGEDVIIGVVDSGIAPGHPSFADTREKEKPRLCRGAFGDSLLGLWLCRRFEDKTESAYGPPPEDWNGVCEAGENFSSAACNNKLIGARYYRAGFDAISNRDNNEFDSARDADGHGTHIASIVAGNVVPAELFGAALGTVSGMAPRARIAVYKACWLEPGGFRASCSVADLQRAIEDAVADGVDIINYSIGDLNDSLDDPDDLALLSAADAGILSVVAAGNDGPTAATILSPGGTPWVLTAGATSRAGEKFEEAIQVNTPESLAGNYASREASFTPALGTVGPITAELELVDDGVIGIDSEGNFGTTTDGCESIGSNVQNAIAFIQRGFCDFQTKVENAETAGALAVIVFNNQGDPILMAGIRDSVAIPAVMIGEADGGKLRDRIALGDTVEVTLDKSLVFSVADAGNVMGSFSARGPNLADSSFLKPDLVAPGVNILAGQTPDVANGIRGQQFQYLSGTSQSVPHVAGIAALLVEAHPDWSPAAIKSALMTTARQDIVKEDRETPADVFDMGAGHIVPNSAVDPGLVYEIATSDYDAYLCGTLSARLDSAGCSALLGANRAPSGEMLNLPSIAVADLVASVTVTRSVTNVGEPEQYSVTIDAPVEIDVSVSPTTLSLDTGESADFDVTFTNQGADPYFWYQGELTWESATHVVRSPFVVRPIPIAVPEQVDGQGTTGSVQIPVEFGYSGSYAATVSGLQEACLLSGRGIELEFGCPTPGSFTVADDPDDNYLLLGDDQLPASIHRIEFTVPANQAFLRVSTFQRFIDDGSGDDDLDVFVYRCLAPSNPNQPCTLFQFQGADSEGVTFTGDEEVNVPYPLPGRYVVDVHGFETDEITGGAGATTSLYVWMIGEDDDRGNLSLSGAPGNVSGGSTASLAAGWQNLDEVLYLGGVSHIGVDDVGDPVTLDNFGDPLITLIAIDATQPTSAP